MNNSNDNTSGTTLESPLQLQEQSKKGLHEFFQNKHIKDLVSVLVPSIIAITLFPFFGHALAVVPGVIAIQNSLKMVGISLSSDTIQKLLQLFQGKPMGEDDMREAIKELLPTDKKVNDEVAKALVVVTPAVKE